MTAEVAVLNKIGVALASDSAVSIGESADKIYTSADKLFQLSIAQPVGLMVYGSASFCGMPWETIVKTFRKELANKSYASLGAYPERFFDYLKKNTYLLPRKIQDTYVQDLIVNIYYLVWERLFEEFESRTEDGKKIDEAEIKDIGSKVCKEVYERVRGHDYSKEFDESSRKNIVKSYSTLVRAIKGDLFKDLPLTRAASRQLTEIAYQMLIRDFFGPVKSGIVFAGFGTNEYMPSLYAYEAEGMVLGSPRVKLYAERCIDDDTTSSVIPFAQREMVFAFMEGVDKALAEYIFDSTTHYFDAVVSAIVDAVDANDKNLGTKLRKHIGAIIDPVRQELFDLWTAERRKYWHPVVQIVSSLPKNELASMAESLVNLTKFRRRVTTDRETVGGPIDVAIITKSDGFVWVRRKHYFDPELNQRVIARFRQEGSG